MLLWSLYALEAVSTITEILVAAPPSALAAFEALRAGASLRKWRAVVPGGETRSESVRLLLERAAGDRVLVHDAARPCIETGWVESLLAELGGDPAGVPALPVRDTLKRGRAGLVVETVDREGLFEVQTPQLFDAAILRRAHAAGGGSVPTDDAALVERLGVPVRILAGSPSNLKVTYPYDVLRAEVFLRENEARS